jgi:hypothetical protein
MIFSTILPNIVIFAICVWAAINPKVHNKTIGAIVLAVIGIGALLNMARNNFFGLLPPDIALLVNSAGAGIALYSAINHKDARRNPRDRDIFLEKRRK